MKPVLALFLILSLAPINSPAQAAARFDFSSLPDTNEARARYLTAAITANWNSAVRFPETYMPTSSGRIQVSLERGQEFFYIRFLRERDGAFPLASTGNTVVQRNYLRNGDLIQAKIFLTDDPSCYIRLYPQGERTRADIILYGAVVKQGVLLTQIFYYQLRDHISHIIAATGGGEDWASFFRSAGEPSAALRFGQALAAGRLAVGGSGARLLSSLAFDETVEKFLTGPSRLFGGAELSAPPAFPFADDRDHLRTVAYRPFPRYEPARGVPAGAAAAFVHAESLARPDDLFAAFVQDGAQSRRILLVPGFDASGTFRIEAYDPSARTALSWAEFEASHQQAYVRLVRIPIPPS